MVGEGWGWGASIVRQHLPYHSLLEFTFSESILSHSG